MSIIKSGTTNTTAYSVDANTNGDLVFIVSESLTAMTISASGAVSLPTSSLTITSGATLNGGVVVNEDGADVDFRIESDTNTHALFVDGATGNVGLGVTPSAWAGATGLQVQNAGIEGRSSANSYATFSANGYTDSGTWEYISTDFASRYTQFQGQHLWFTAPSGTAGDPITFTQVLGVGLGTSLALQGATSQTGTGITFPATQSASSNANTLDDYEEGSFTPTIGAEVSNPTGISYSLQSGSYTKIGNVVYIRLRVSFSFTGGTGSGAFQISGLPFTSRTGISHPRSVPQQDNVSYTGFTYLDMGTTSNSTVVGLAKNRSGSGANSVVIGDCASGGTDVNGGFFYFI
jgi:hypothetical protein